VHGRTSAVIHNGTSIFTGLPSPLRVTRYHSLSIARASVPAELDVLATATDDGEIMALAHREHPVVGVQFHPESAATEYGYAMLDRFLRGSASRAGDLPSRADGASAPADTAARRKGPWRSPEERAADAFVPPPVERVR
jgi:hypothetical protein